MRIKPPYIHMGFYFHTLPEAEALLRIVSACTELGAQLTGKIEIEQPDTTDDRQWLSTDRRSKLITLEPSTALEELRRRKDIHPLLVYIRNAIGTVPDAIEEISVSVRRQDLLTVCKSPVTIYTDGAMFFPEAYMDKNDKRLAQRSSTRIHNKIRALSIATQPDYAAVTAEFSLPCLSELKSEPFFPFSMLYMSANTFSASRLDELRSLYQGAAIETLPTGVLISTGLWQRSSRLWSDTEKHEKASRVAQLIVEQFYNG